MIMINSIIRNQSMLDLLTIVLLKGLAKVPQDLRGDYIALLMYPIKCACALRNVHCTLSFSQAVERVSFIPYLQESLR